VRETSLAAYELLVSSGALRGQLAVVARAVAEHGPGTATEILVAAGLDRNRNLARARLVELRERGTVAERGARECAVTGRRAAVYAFAGEYNTAQRRRPLAAWRQLALDAISGLPDSDIARSLRARRDALLATAAPRAIAPDP
jgi:predicted ArsR family transcriptional regulator